MNIGLEKKINIKYLIFLFFFFITLVLNLQNDLSYLTNISVVFMLIINILIIWKSRCAPILFIFSIFLFGYTYVYSLPFLYGINIAGIGSYNNLELLSKVGLELLIFMFFLGSLTFELSNSRKKFFLQDTLIKYENKIKKNKLISFALFLVCILFLVFVRTGNDKTSLVSLPFEYFFIFVIVLKIYSTDNFFNRVMIHCLLIFASLKTLVNNGRIEFIIAFLLLFIFYYEKKIKISTIFLIVVFALVFLEFYGIFRNGLDFKDIEYSKYFFDRFNPPILIDSTEGYVLHSSMSIIGLIEDGFFSMQERITSFLKMILLQFLPIGRFPFFYNVEITSYIQSFTTTLGGALIFSQWYFWLGNLGVVIVSFLICKIIKFSYNKSNIFSIFCFTSFIFFPRWLSYFSNFLIKVPFQIVILLVCIKLFTSFFKSK